ncbi:MAG: hypothetical protein OXF41_02405 [bacterium]|nr:hypothetical protein [bacterium]
MYTQHLLGRLAPPSVSRRVSWPILLLAVAVMATAPAPSRAGAQDAGFADSADAGVHRPAVDALAGWGYFEGTECDTGRFCPEDPIDRWVMAVWLVRALGYTPRDTGESRFDDVSADEWWSPYAERIARQEITSGCEEAPLRYCPDRPVTRGMMATFLVRALRIEEAPPAGFVDTAGDTHEAAIDALAAAGITSACKTEPLSYCPSKPVTRGQMATFLHRAIRTSDRAILAVLYHTTDGPNWTSNKNWLTPGPLEGWGGVTTDDDDRVTHLVLEANGLAGPIPPLLAYLSQLESLKLPKNSLTGPIPPRLNSLRQLKVLDLSDNLLDGPIPSGLTELTLLEYLALGGNKLSGAIPSGFGNLADLELLSLRDNRLTGAIPAEVGTLTSLTWMSLARNGLDGPIPPELGNLANLRALILSYNRLSGSIPPELGRLSDLVNLYLDNNHLTGEIPDQLGNLTLLTLLDVANNWLEGRIPASLGDLPDLNYVRFHGGNRFVGCVPAGLMDTSHDFSLMELPFC